MNLLFKSIVYSLPCSPSLSYWWNWGSILGIALSAQILSGFLLLLNYNSYASYETVMFIIAETNYGWFLKLFHSNNAGLIFVVLYLHLSKNLSLGSYRLQGTWNSGVLIIVLIMGAAFSGYVLVGSQISFWAAQVITSLISVIPVNGETLLYFVWGGYSINWVTIQLLFVVHFVLPLLVMLVIVYHLISLHNSGSTNSLFNHSGGEKLSFFPYFWVKDIMNFLLYFVVVIFMLLYPYSMGEVELFEEANPLSSPVHISPEFYFLPYYAILRSVPSKSMGVLLIVFSLLVYFLLPYSSNYYPQTSFPFGGLLLILLVILGYLGGAPISAPFIYMSLFFTFLYFSLFFVVIFINLFNEYFFKLNNNNINNKPF